MKKRLLLVAIAVFGVLSMLMPMAISGSAASTYVINGVSVRYDTFSSEPDECWEYANKLYNKIWGYRFSNAFDAEDNMLRELEDTDLTLTAEHLKAYVSAAPLGSCLRICDSEYLHGSDGWGHSQIIVQKDDAGFTVLEGGLSAAPYCRERYYTWDSYCDSSWPGKYEYIKYIKYPNATPYAEGYLSKCTFYSSYCTVKLTVNSSDIRTLPCSANTDSASQKIETASKGDEYVTVGLYKNTAGNYWYKVKASNGSIGYLHAKGTELVRTLSDITVSGVSAPTEIVKGNSFVIGGEISTSYTKLTHVGAYVLSGSTVKTGKENLEVSSNYYSLKGSTLDSNVKFGSLAAGTYTYRIQAQYVNCYVKDTTTLQTVTTRITLYEKTFTVVTSATCTHSWGAYQADSNNHWKVCSKCGATTAKQSHSGGTASCTAKAVCSTCNVSYGSVKNHSYTVLQTDGSYHWYKCSGCTATSGKAAHSGGTASCTAKAVCSTCNVSYGSVKSHSYTVLQTDESHHWYKCSGCTATSGKAAHSGGTASCTAKAVCSTCNVSYGSVKSHSYTVLQTDGSYHWYKCSGCTATSGKAAHSGGTASCTAKAVCSTCNVSYGSIKAHSYTVLQSNGTDHWHKCAHCSATTSTQAHSGGTASCTKQAACSVCGASYGSLKSHSYTVPKSDSSSHWYQCADCGSNGSKTNHVPGEAATETDPQICTVCSYVIAPATGHILHSYTVLQTDESHHWYKCSDCEAISEKATHSGGTATCTQQAACEVCQTIYGQLENHQFTVIQGDDSFHWNGCAACPAVDEKKAHSCGDDNICDVCGYAVQTATPDPTEPVPTDPDPAETEPTNPIPTESHPDTQDKQEDDSNPWIAISIVLTVLVFCMLGALLLLLMKRRV